MMMDVSHTQRGFTYIGFKDHYGAQCSLQKSGLATEDAIWLGVEQTPDGVPVYIGDDGLSNPLPAGRMHLTQEQVRELLPYLTDFARTGELFDPAAAEASKRRAMGPPEYLIVIEMRWIEDEQRWAARVKTVWGGKVTMEENDVADEDSGHHFACALDVAGEWVVDNLLTD